MFILRAEFNMVYCLLASKIDKKWVVSGSIFRDKSVYKFFIHSKLEKCHFYELPCFNIIFGKTVPNCFNTDVSVLLKLGNKSQIFMKFDLYCILHCCTCHYRYLCDTYWLKCLWLQIEMTIILSEPK